MNLSCIVCAIDSADRSPEVLASAMALAALDNAELHVMYLAEGASESHDQVPSIAAPHHETRFVRGGDPVTAVLDHARHVRADLIVMGFTPRVGAVGKGG